MVILQEIEPWIRKWSVDSSVPKHLKELERPNTGTRWGVSYRLLKTKKKAFEIEVWGDILHSIFAIQTTAEAEKTVQSVGWDVLSL